MNLAAWNVRGLNKSSHQKELIHFVSTNNLSIMCCVETKVKENHALEVSKRINKNWSWIFNYEHHYNGRIWLGFDSSIWSISVISKSNQQMTCNLEFLEKKLMFCATFVYAFNQVHERETLWRDLFQLSTNISLPWVAMGDFNCVLSLEEIHGGRERWTSGMQAFKDCVYECGLGHLQTIGDTFTWTNKRLPNHLISKKLDRILGNQLWFNTYIEATVVIKHKRLMDHSPLFLSIPTNISRKMKPFQFFNYMLAI